MASNPPQACCATGFRHVGEPTGQTTSISNITTYIARPEESRSQKINKAVIIISDIFGIFTNSQLLADDFAAHGYLAILPDLFDGDKLPLDAFESGKIDFGKWFAKHDVTVVDPIITTIIKHVREELNVERIAGIGYCFGGKYVVRLLKDDAFDAGYIAHPSFVGEEELSGIRKPLSISAAETDDIFTKELRFKSEDILVQAGQPWQINLFSGVSHGFAVRGDLSQKRNKFAKEQAFMQAAAWLKEHL